MSEKLELNSKVSETFAPRDRDGVVDLAKQFAYEVLKALERGDALDAESRTKDLLDILERS